MRIRFDGDESATGGVSEAPRRPYFSICIPQYNRTSFLIEAIRWLGLQTFRDMQICVSDDCSNDGREAELVDALRASGLPFVYERQEKNCRYDGNLRAAINMSSGKYCYLLGNDDRPSTVDELAKLHAEIEVEGEVGVVIANYEELTDGRIVHRMPVTANLGGGPRVAIQNFRNFSFVSGVVLNGDRARALTTDKWDGSEMYQTYVGCRLIASGLSLLERGGAMVRKDLVVPGEYVDSVATRPKVWPCPVVVRPTTLTQFGRLVADAIAPHAGPAAAQLNEAVLLQHLGFTMPFWLFEYRKLQSRQYAAGVALGLQPSRSAAGVPLGWRRARVWLVYLAAALGGLALPREWFDAARGRLYRLAKSVR